MTGLVANPGIALLDLWEACARADPVTRGTLLMRLSSRRAAEDGDIDDLPLGQRNRVLMDILGQLGRGIEGTVTCPGCDETIEVDLPVKALLATNAGLTPEPIPLGEASITWRLPTTADLLAASHSADPAEAYDVLLQRCVTHIDGTVGAEDVAAAIAIAIEATDPLSDLELLVTCPACGDPQKISVDPVDHLWREIDARARDLIDEVAVLARAYGWTEAEVLAVPPTRRRAYLELVGDE
jgi:hypothetical protein